MREAIFPSNNPGPHVGLIRSQGFLNHSTRMERTRVECIRKNMAVFVCFHQIPMFTQQLFFANSLSFQKQEALCTALEIFVKFKFVLKIY